MKALVKLRPEKGIWMEDIPTPHVGINDVLIKIKKIWGCLNDYLYFLKHPAKSHAFRQFWGDSRSPWSCKIAWRQFWLRKWEQGGSLENKKSSEKLEKLTIRISKSKKEMLKKMVEKKMNIILENFMDLIKIIYLIK